MREHDRGLGQLISQKTAAHVVHVVFVEIVGGAAGDDGLQRLRLPGGDLQPVEPAPGDPEHAHVAIAPGLRGDPVDDRHAVGQLVFGVFIHQNAVGLAAADHVHAHAGIAVAGEVGVVDLVAPAGQIALAVGQIFENRGNGVVARILGHPEPGRQAPPVRKRDPGMFVASDGVGELRDFPHVVSFPVPPLLLRLEALPIAELHRKPGDEISVALAQPLRTVGAQPGIAHIETINRLVG